ncbi:MAG: 50S ribosomal protein L5 [Phycisphaerales bacterium]
MSKEAPKDNPKAQEHAAKNAAKAAAKKGPASGGGHGSKKYSAEVMAAAEAAAKEPPRLKARFEQQVREKLASVHGVKNRFAQPKLEKIVININVGRHLEGTKVPPNVRDQVIDTVQKISGQKPIMIRSRKSVSNFKLREGYESSYMVTLRRDRMWFFLDRLINLATPRIKDFRGLNDKAFDRQGNYAMGLTEQGVFPEINMAEAQFTHGMHINFVFRNSGPKLSRFVLEELGMPFRKPEENTGKSKSK